MENTKIAWANHTFNHIRGCTKISEGCANCYAERDSHRNPGVLGVWGPDGTREVAAEAQWRNPLKWNRAAEAAGARARVFCASLADVFEGPETFNAANNDVHNARERLFRLIDDTPHLDWLLLTKRPQHVLALYNDYLHWDRGDEWPKNLWIGMTIENSKRMEERAKYAKRIREAGCPVVFASCEPLLEGIDLRPWLDRDRGINWVIAGGESGAANKIRPLDPLWARMLRDQCGDAGVPYFFKQLGNGVVGLTYKGKGEDWNDVPEDLRVREFPTIAA